MVILPKNNDLQIHINADIFGTTYDIFFFYINQPFIDTKPVNPLTKTTSFKTALQNGFKHPIHTNVANKK